MATSVITNPRLNTEYILVPSSVTSWSDLVTYIANNVTLVNNQSRTFGFVWTGHTYGTVQLFNHSSVLVGLVACISYMSYFTYNNGTITIKSVTLS